MSLDVARNDTNLSLFQHHIEFCGSPYSLPMHSALFVVYMLCLPIFLSTLYLLYKKFNKSVLLSHSDVFTLNMIMMEMFKVLGVSLTFYSVYRKVNDAVCSVGIILAIFPRFGQMFFNSLTCLERYLAVVHPITYLRSKERGGVKIRNTCIGLIWLFNVGHSTLVYEHTSIIMYNHICSLLLILSSFLIVLFCTASVFRSLTQPGLGEGGGDRKSINNSKRLALNIIKFILAAQVLGCVNLIMFYVWTEVTKLADLCLLFGLSFWLELPNSLVSPLLFLHRTKKHQQQQS